MLLASRHQLLFRVSQRTPDHVCLWRHRWRSCCLLSFNNTSQFAPHYFNSLQSAQRQLTQTLFYTNCRWLVSLCSTTAPPYFLMRLCTNNCCCARAKWEIIVIEVRRLQGLALFDWTSRLSAPRRETYANQSQQKELLLFFVFFFKPNQNFGE